MKNNENAMVYFWYNNLKILLIEIIKLEKSILNLIILHQLIASIQYLPFLLRLFKRIPMPQW